MATFSHTVLANAWSKCDNSELRRARSARLTLSQLLGSDSALMKCRMARRQHNRSGRSTEVDRPDQITSEQPQHKNCMTIVSMRQQGCITRFMVRVMQRSTSAVSRRACNIVGTFWLYCCDSSRSWQCGTRENTNGLLHQYLPKLINLNVFNQDELDAIADSMNNHLCATQWLQ